MISWIKSGFLRNTWWSRLIFSLQFFAVILLYPLSNWLADLNGRYVIWQFPIDDLIIFNRWFVLPYYYWYFQLGIGIAWLILSPKTGRLLHRLILALVFAGIICTLFYLIIPTYMVRPELTGQDFLTQMVRNIYAADRPYNCFPSQHVVSAVIVSRFWALAGSRRLWFKIINYGGTVLIVLSTVFIKQHYTPDILGGLAVACLGCLFSDWLFHKLKLRKSLISQ